MPSFTEQREIIAFGTVPFFIGISRLPLILYICIAFGKNQTTGATVPAECPIRLCLRLRGHSLSAPEAAG
jgi:hypothetical protein